MEENIIVSDTTTNDDRISQLPDFILHHILSFLGSSLLSSPAYLVRTSVLSKKWLALTASYPNLHFNINRFIILKNSSRIRFDHEYIIDRFFKYVEYTMSRFCEQNVTSAQTFNLITQIQSPTQQDIIDRCIRLILKKGVQEFVIDICGKHRFSEVEEEDPPMYRLPNILLSTFSIKSLMIRYCILPSSFMVDTVKFTYLKLLKLDEVNINEEGIKYLTTNCPLLEEIYIHRCYGFKRLCVYGLQNLQKVEIFYMPEIEIIDIQAPNLTYLFLLDWKERLTPPSINLASRKKLTLRSYGYFSKKFSESLSNFPFLENLTLKLSSNIKNVKLSSHSLRNLVILSQSDLDEIQIETPNLRCFNFSQKSYLPQVMNSNESKARLECISEYFVDSIWFQKMRQFLDKSSPQFKILKLIIRANFVDVNELKMIQWSPYELEHLNLFVYSIKNLSVYEAVIDAVLWCCRPQSLSLSFGISLNDFEEWNKVFKFIYVKLLEQEDESQTTIRFVMSSFSNAEKHFGDLTSLVFVVPCGERLQETITFIKDKVAP